MKKLILSALVILILAQILVPVYMIANKYDTLRSGIEYKFRVEPVDPYDAFRGRYLVISLTDINRASINGKGGAKKYAVIKNNADGFADIDSFSDQKPDGVDFVKGKIQYGSFRLPIDRYYMDEKLAPKAETIYRENRQEAYVTVRVKNGNVVVSGLFINGIAIEEYVKQQMEQDTASGKM